MKKLLEKRLHTRFIAVSQINVCNFVVPTWFIILHISTMALQGNTNYWIVINAFIAKFELIS